MPVHWEFSGFELVSSLKDKKEETSFMKVIDLVKQVHQKDFLACADQSRRGKYHDVKGDFIEKSPQRHGIPLVAHAHFSGLEASS